MFRQGQFFSFVVAVACLFTLGSVSTFAAQDIDDEPAAPHGSHGDLESGDRKMYPDPEEDAPHGSHGDIKPAEPHEEDSPHGSHGDAE